MKNKNIVLLFLVFGVAFQTVSAMNFLSKIPLVGSACHYVLAKQMMAAFKKYNEHYDVVERLGSGAEEKGQHKEFSELEKLLFPSPPQLSAPQRGSFKELGKKHGIDLFFAPKGVEGFLDDNNNKKSQAARACIFALNKEAVLTLNSSMVDLCEKGKDEHTVLGIVLHELGHAVHRHFEKELALEAAVTTLHLGASSHVYADALEHFGTSEVEWVSQLAGLHGCGASLCALGAFVCAQKSILPRIKNLYSQYHEHEADRYVMEHGSTPVIEAQRKHYEQMIVLDNAKPSGLRHSDIPSFQRTHPTHKERAAAFAAELARRKSLEEKK